MANRAATELYLDLPWQSRAVVDKWRALGHDMVDSLLQSNAIGAGELVTPQEARAEENRKRHRRQQAEHESSHAVVAEALGLRVKSAKIIGDGGECIHTKGTKLEEAIIAMAPQIWIEKFRSDVFIYGARGLEDDHATLAELGCDKFFLRQAMDHCYEILRQNSAQILAAADQIEKYGHAFF